ncbi:hypothetical protein E2986_13616, partial [Frieseomelitta varia]
IIYLYFIIFIIFISIIIFNLNKFLSIIRKINLEKKIPFECGFNPISKFLLPFSIPFFLIRLLFLIFDIEITLLIPIIFYLKYINFYYIINTISLFIFIILITLILE